MEFTSEEQVRTRLARTEQRLEPLAWLKEQIPLFKERRWVLYTQEGVSNVLVPVGQPQNGDDPPCHPWEALRYNFDPAQHSGIGWYLGSGQAWGLNGKYCLRDQCVLVVDEALDSTFELTVRARRIAETLGVYAEINQEANTLLLFCETPLRARLDSPEQASLREHGCHLLGGKGAWCPITGVPAFARVSKSTRPDWEGLLASFQAASSPILPTAVAAEEDAPSTAATAQDLPMETEAKPADPVEAAEEINDGGQSSAPGAQTIVESEPIAPPPLATSAAIDAAAKDLESHWVRFQFGYVQTTASANAGIMLSHTKHFLSDTRWGYVDSAGWVLCNHSQWLDQVGLTQQNQRSARERLRESGCWEENGREGKAFRFRLVEEKLPPPGRGFVSYHPSLAKRLGSPHAALIARHGVYLTEEKLKKDGWFRYDWAKLGLTGREISIACALLKSRSILEETRVGRITHYRVNREELLALLRKDGKQAGSNPANTLEAGTCCLSDSNVLAEADERVGLRHEVCPPKKNSAQESSLRSSSCAGTQNPKQVTEVHAACGSSALAGDTSAPNSQKGDSIASLPSPESTPLESTPIESTPLESTPLGSTPLDSTPTGVQRQPRKPVGASTRHRTIGDWCYQRNIGLEDLREYLARFLQRSPSEGDLEKYIRGIERFEGKSISHHHEVTGKEITRHFVGLDEDHLEAAVQQAEQDWCAKGGTATRTISWLIIGTEKALERVRRSLYMLGPDGRHLFTPHRAHPREGEWDAWQGHEEDLKPVSFALPLTRVKAERLIAKKLYENEENWTLEPPPD